MDRENVDTDAIIPKQFLKSIRKTGFGPNLFDAWRYLDPGEPGQDPASRKINPDFVLNQPRYKGASVLLARKNFGCGSSREHAPWALDQYGFRAIIAPSYADIFFNNSFKNGLLPIVLPEAQVATLFAEALAFPGYTLSIDLERQVIVKPQGEEIPFNVEVFRKYCLINGLDDIGLTMVKAKAIDSFELKAAALRPWASNRIAAFVCYAWSVQIMGSAWRPRFCLFYVHCASGSLRPILCVALVYKTSATFYLLGRDLSAH
eukprot:gene44645-59581_t